MNEWERRYKTVQEQLEISIEINDALIKQNKKTNNEKDERIKELENCLVDLDKNLMHFEPYRKRGCDMSVRKALGLKPNEAPNPRRK